MDDCSCCQEEQSFEIGMCGQVKNTCAIVMHTLTHKHVTKLTDGRISQHTLDIQLEHSNGCGEERCHTADSCYDIQCERGQLKQGIGTRNKIYSCGDHCCRVDERADRRWTFHCIWEPHIERQLCRFRRTRYKEQQTNCVCGFVSRQLAEDTHAAAIIEEVQCAEISEDEEDGKHQGKITDNIDD